MKLFKALVGLAAAASVIPLKVEKVEEDGKKTVRISSLTWKAEYTSATPEDDATLNVDLMGGLKELVKKKEKPAEEETEVSEESADLEEVVEFAEAEENDDIVSLPVEAPDFDLADRVSGGGIRWADLESADVSADAEEVAEVKELGEDDLKAIAGRFGELMEDADGLLCDVVDTVVELGKASTSMLQRKFQIGYGRATKMIDTLNKCRIVSDSKGAKPRDVLITVEQWNKIKVQIKKSDSVETESPVTTPETETE